MFIFRSKSYNDIGPILFYDYSKYVDLEFKPFDHHVITKMWSCCSIYTTYVSQYARAPYPVLFTYTALKIPPRLLYVLLILVNV